MHFCHAKKCLAPVVPEMFMCRKHWNMLPQSKRDDVWDTYIPGQEIRKDPTDKYLKAAREAIRYVYKEEAKNADS